MTNISDCFDFASSSVHAYSTTMGMDKNLIIPIELDLSLMENVKAPVTDGFVFLVNFYSLSCRN